jgi:hypothetical protein
MHLSNQALLEDSPEILTAAQEATSNLLPTKPRNKYIQGIIEMHGIILTTSHWLHVELGKNI